MECKKNNCAFQAKYSIVLYVMCVLSVKSLKDVLDSNITQTVALGKFYLLSKE